MIAGVDKGFPVLPFGPYRRYPTCASQQRDVKDERRVCANCLSGTCCSSEGPIGLTSFDILRLAAFFDMAPARFLQTFTQDRFSGEKQDERRRWIENADSSIVTFLRRRANYAASPCIFLKYVHDKAGTPRRICSVHPARPLACREYYYDTCKKRWTGEQAVIQSQGLEMIRQGKITHAMVEDNLKRLEPVTEGDSLRKKWQFAFWSEMRRALDVKRANNEGANSYPIADFQDPIDEKLNRMLSARYLRFEEKYGPEPQGEQLQPYSMGLSFVGSPDYQRILRIARTAPSHGLFGQQDYPHYLGIRTMMPGTRLAGEFGRFTEKQEPYANAVVRGWNFLLGLAAHAVHVGDLIELEPRGAFELALLEALLPFGEALQKRVGGAACLEPVKQWAGAVAALVYREGYKSLAATRVGSMAWFRLYCVAARFDSSTAPPNLRRIISLLRTQVRRRLASVERGNRLNRWLQPQPRPRTPQEWKRLIERIDDLGAIQALVSAAESMRMRRRVLENLERIAFAENEAVCMFQALDAFGRAARLSSSERCRAADLALRWSAGAEEDHLWEDETLLGWARLCARLGIAGSQTPGFARSIRHILSLQSFDGSWGTDLPPEDLPDWQGNYLLAAVRSTSAAVEGLCAALFTTSSA